MRTMQPPITSEEEYRGYQKGRDTLTKSVAERERRLFEALAQGDVNVIEARRAELFHVLRDRQAIIDALHEYEAHTTRSA